MFGLKEPVNTVRPFGCSSDARAAPGELGGPPCELPPGLARPLPMAGPGLARPLAMAGPGLARPLAMAGPGLARPLPVAGLPSLGRLLQHGEASLPLL